MALIVESNARLFIDLNIIKKHVKSTKEKKGGIFDKENFIHMSNLKIIDDKNLKKGSKVK